MTRESGPDVTVEKSDNSLVYLLGNGEQFTSELLKDINQSDYLIKTFTEVSKFEEACAKLAPLAIAIDDSLGDIITTDIITDLKKSLTPCPPIIYLSYIDNIETRLASSRAGVHRFLCKPLNMDKFILSLNSVMAQEANKHIKVALVISDNTMRESCVILLQEAGMKVEPLSNPLESFKLLAKFRPDVFVIDADMPQCSGAELLHMIRQDDSWALMPVIILSSEQNTDANLVEMNHGGDDFVIQPLKPGHLVAAVTARAKRSLWTDRLSKDLKSLLRENKYQLGTMNKHNIVSTTDVSGRITHVNDKFCEISGYSRPELIGQNHRLLKSDVHTQEFYYDMWNTISQGKVWRGTICNRKKNGGVYWVESSIVPFLNDQGKPYKYVSARTDVTALHESEDLLHRSQSIAHIGSWDWNLLTGKIYWSDFVWQIYGLKQGAIETNSENCGALMHPDDIESAHLAVTDCIKNGNKFNIEHRVLWPNKSAHWVQVNGDVIRNKNGDPINMIGVIQDIDKRKRAELALIERQRQLQEAQSLARIGNWQTNVFTGEIIWSDEICRIMGYEPGSFVPSEEFFYNIIHPDDQERVKNSANWAEKEGQKDLVYRISLPDGTTRHIHDLAMVDMDAEGNLIMQSGTMQDITERMEVETKLRETQDRFTFAVEGAGDGVWDWDLKTDIMQFSQLYLSMLGYDENKLPHHVDSWINNIHPDDLTDTKLKLNQYLEGRTQKYSLELRMLCKDGNYKWILCRGTIVSRDYEGQPVRMIGIHSDITKQKQIEQELIDAREEAQDANRAKTEFLSSMSHELRTPMNAIMGFGQLLKMEVNPPLSESQEENVNEIVTASHHLLELINEILDLAKIEAGRVDLTTEVITLSDVIADSLQLITPLAQRRGIEITLTQNGIGMTYKQLSQDHSTIYADRIRLKQILLNLLSNAIKYNEEKGKLIVDFYNISRDRMRISITDTGKGLSREEQTHLFIPFSRVGDEQKKVEGVGIGLVITKNLVELMGGTIGMESQRGVGSTFWFELPRVNMPLLQKSEPNGDTTSQANNAIALNHEFSILYIEDNPANLRLVTQLLERRPNIHMWSAPEPILGLELAAEHKPDLILLDINLPSMNGFEVLDRLRKRHATKETPVIAISANAMPYDIKRGINSGFNDYITKPIDVTVLLQAVEKALQEGK